MWYPTIGDVVCFQYRGREQLAQIIEVEDNLGGDGPDIKVRWNNDVADWTTLWIGARYLEWEGAQERLI